MTTRSTRPSATRPARVSLSPRSRARLALTPTYAPVVDYIIDYTREHLSPVIGRALRVYSRSRPDRHGCGVQHHEGAAQDVRRARAVRPRAVRPGRAHVGRLRELARHRARSSDRRSSVCSRSCAGRSMVSRFPCFSWMRASAPELEESFASSTKLRWDYATLTELGEDPDAIETTIVERWFASRRRPRRRAAHHGRHRCRRSRCRSRTGRWCASSGSRRKRSRTPRIAAATSIDDAAAVAAAIEAVAAAEANADELE